MSSAFAAIPPWTPITFDDPAYDEVWNRFRARFAFRPSPSSTLDWQHQGYRLRPHAMPAPRDLDTWEISALPEGDYHIFVAPDLSFGVFGHPWEWTMCVFGKPLVDALARNVPWVFDGITRVDGVQR